MVYPMSPNVWPAWGKESGTHLSCRWAPLNTSISYTFRQTSHWSSLSQMRAFCVTLHLLKRPRICTGRLAALQWEATSAFLAFRHGGGALYKALKTRREEEASLCWPGAHVLRRQVGGSRSSLQASPTYRLSFLWVYFLGSVWFCIIHPWFSYLFRAVIQPKTANNQW